jgi:hypothetical protein
MYVVLSMRAELEWPSSDCVLAADHFHVGLLDSRLFVVVKAFTTIYIISLILAGDMIGLFTI